MLVSLFLFTYCFLKENHVFLLHINLYAYIFVHVTWLDTVGLYVKYAYCSVHILHNIVGQHLLLV